MTLGLSNANLANKWLDVLGPAGTTFTTFSCFVKLHTGDPTAAGAGAVSSVTTRPAIAWAAAATGSKAINGTLPAWTAWAGTNGEIVSHMSVWDASTAGNFLYSFILTLAKTMNTGDTLTLSAHTLSLTPIAA